MGLYDFMYLVPREQFQSMKRASETTGGIDGIGGNVQDSHVNKIEVTDGGTIVIGGESEIGEGLPKVSSTEEGGSNERANATGKKKSLGRRGKAGGKRRRGGKAAAAAAASVVGSVPIASIARGAPAAAAEVADVSRRSEAERERGGQPWKIERFGAINKAKKVSGQSDQDVTMKEVEEEMEIDRPAPASKKQRTVDPSPRRTIGGPPPTKNRPLIIEKNKTTKKAPVGGAAKSDRAIMKSLVQDRLATLMGGRGKKRAADEEIGRDRKRRIIHEIREVGRDAASGGLKRTRDDVISGRPLKRLVTSRPPLVPLKASKRATPLDDGTDPFHKVYDPPPPKKQNTRSRFVRPVGRFAGVKRGRSEEDDFADLLEEEEQTGIPFKSRATMYDDA